VGQRSDALALGSLTHNGLDNWKKVGKPVIDDEIRMEINPTPETLQLAEVMIRGYVQKYPREVWEVEETEAAVEFPLEYNPDRPVSGWTGVAKLDGYFYVQEDTTIESGLPGQTLTLGRGWWSREYKTKSHGIPRDTWFREWSAKRQADFQLLALHHLIEQRPRHHDNDTTIRGVLVSVLEKPREYVPRRKCKGCENTYDLSSYRTHADGQMCPMCGYVQNIKPYIPSVPSAPEYYRLVVTRSPEQLEVARREITMVAEAMADLRDQGPTSVVPNRDNCISNRYHSVCAYAEDHIGGTTVAEPKYVRIDPYRYIGL
jgi:hypothetical protein